MTQAEALSILKTGANVFLTGEPGSGKTYIVNQYVQYLRDHNITTAITASTGIAATHIGGMTIHSWSGIGIKKELSERDLRGLSENKRLVSRAKKTNVLIIDEISMLDAAVISSIDQAIQALRDNSGPFGGLQVVFVGDFFQLPPVTKGNQTINFAFTSPSWAEAKPVTCYLSEQHRQMDEAFSSLLRSVRSGHGADTDHSLLLSQQVIATQQTTITRLYTHNINVDRLNNEKLAELPGTTQTFHMTSQGNKNLVEQLKKGCLSPEELILKKGAQVMCTKNNYEKGFVNGTLGEVIDFGDQGPVIRTRQGYVIDIAPMDWEIKDNDKTLASVEQIPLRLAWAITVHKSQGMTLDAAVIDLSGAFEYGQGYVAISRVRSLVGLHITGINKHALQVHPEIVAIDNVFRTQSQHAITTLARYTKQDMRTKHAQFITRCGGSIKKVSRPTLSRSTYEETLTLYQKGKTITQIAKARNLKPGTIISHLETLKGDKKLTKNDLQRVIPARLKKVLPQIHQSFSEHGDEKLSPVFHALNGKYSYDTLRLARLVR